MISNIATSTRKMIRYSLFLFSLLFSFPSYSQTAKLDSLRTAMSHAEGIKKLNIVVELCKERNSFPADTFLKYINIAEELNTSFKDERAHHEINYFKAGYLQVTGNLDSAIKLCDKNIEALKGNVKLGDIRRKNITNKAALLIRNDRIKDAIQLAFDVLKEAEKENDTVAIIAAENCLGWANMELNNYPEAIIWLKKAEITSGTNYQYSAYLVSNLASCYNNMHQNDSALITVNRAIDYGKRSGELKSLANAYAIKSAILIEMNNSSGAEEAMKAGMEIRKQIGDQFYVISDMYQLGIFYANTNQCEKGIAICKEGLDIAMKYKFSAKLIILYEALGKNYKACNRYAEYSEVLDKLIVLKDSLYKKNSAEALAEMQTKYEVENKEKIILKQEYTLARRNYLIYGSMLLFALAAVITLLVFKQYKTRQRAIAVRAITIARENERKRIATELHDNIGTQLSYISRKIEYMNSDNSSFHEKHLASLHDITSSARRSIGDLRETIWALKKEEININDLADRLKVFVHKELEDQNDIQLHINENIESVVLFSSIESLNIFRIMQEAIHNAGQHSHCSNLYLDFNTSENGKWKITLKDDGRGFDTSLQYNDHFGLENMTQRAKETNLPLTIESKKGEGTTISLSGNSKQI